MHQPSRRALATIAALAATLVACGAPARSDTGGIAQAANPVPSDGTQVIASRREVRVIFARDTATRWGWPAASSPDDRAGYVWSVSFDGVDGPESLALRVDRGDGAARDFASLAEVVATGRVAWCRPGMIYGCPDAGVSTSVERGRVVLVLRDSARIAALLALRPAVARSAHVTRGVPGIRRDDSVRVRYVDPQIPEPSAELRAEAARRRRLAEIGGIRRSIDSDHGLVGGALWLVVGDSAEVHVEEQRCWLDVCTAMELESNAGWLVADTTIARVRGWTRADLRRTFGIRSGRGYLVARGPGRTTLRVAGLRSPEDTVTGRPPSPRELAIDVAVTPPIERVELGAIPDTVTLRARVRTRVRVVDRTGGVHGDAPVTIIGVHGEGVVERFVADSADLVFYGLPGRRMLVASFAGRADTAYVHVVTPPER